MKKIFIAALWTNAVCLAALAAGTPKIQFEQTVYDFGKTSQVETVSGVFKFKNVGDATLKVEPPKPSCGCTIASLKPDTLAPGESGELAFTLNLGRAKTQLEKHIAVTSNDPQTPEVTLAIKADYTPLYELNPMTLNPSVAFGARDIAQSTTLTRNDGRPLRIERLDPSKPWIKAVVEPGAKADDAIVRIRVTIQREGAPRHFNEFVQIYAAGETNTPVSSIYISGEMQGEVLLEPEALYWSVSAATNASADRPEALVVRRVTIRSSNGKALQLNNPQSSIKGITAELVTKESGKVYELVARLEETPATTVSGNVSFETSVAAKPKIEVPVIVNVFKP
jgi:hypothetical protein